MRSDITRARSLVTTTLVVIMAMAVPLMIHAGNENLKADNTALIEVKYAPSPNPGDNDDQFIYVPLLLKNYPTLGVIVGQVMDTAGDALDGVTVTAEAGTATTNEQGWFTLPDVLVASRVRLMFTKEGYATAHRLVDVEPEQNSYISAVMSAVDTTEQVDAGTGGTATTDDGEGSIELGPNSLVDEEGNPFDGTATVSVTAFDPTDEMEIDAFPGEYLGINAASEQVPLKSYGFMNIAVADGSGEPLQLAAGKTATITTKVPTALRSEAASLGTCPLWTYDPETGYWQEEGQGSYDAASEAFVGAVSHLSTWNWDVAYPRAFISGRVINSIGLPVEGARVECWGEGWKFSRWASGETGTGADGLFECIPVECTVTFTCRASKGNVQSPEYALGPYACDESSSWREPNVCHDVGDMVLPGGGDFVQIALTWDEDPRDLDAHLAADVNGTFHIYYMNKGSLTSEPYAYLDTDDTDSYGPEIVTITNLRAGTYRYSVRHYAGEGTIATSDAVVSLLVPGGDGYRTFTPPSGQSSETDIWRIVDIVVNDEGGVTLHPINDYVTGGNTSDLLFP